MKTFIIINLFLVLCNGYTFVNVPKTTPSTTISIESTSEMSSISTTTSGSTSTQSVTSTTSESTSTSTQATTKTQATSTPSTTTSTSTTPASVINGSLPKVTNETNSTSTVNTTLLTPRELDRSFYPNYYCKCDLKLKICDINCCCDIDCTDKIIKIMDCSETYLDQNDYEEEQGLPSCEVSSSWFCVLEKEDDRKPNRDWVSYKHTRK